MKLHLTFFSICFIFSAMAQNPTVVTSNNNMSGRQVFPNAMEMWEASYNVLVGDGAIGPDSSAQTTVYFKLDTIAKLLGFSPTKGPSTSNEIIDFCIYLDAEKNPHMALVKEGNWNTFLIHDSNGNAQVVDSTYLSNGFYRWAALTDPLFQTFIPVKRFRYDWSSILTYCSSAKHYLSLTFVAHTVSPNSVLFPVPQDNNEGWVTLDVILRGVAKSPNGGYTGNPNYYDFAMPCPKNCPSM